MAAEGAPELNTKVINQAQAQHMAAQIASNAAVEEEMMNKAADESALQDSTAAKKKPRQRKPREPKEPKFEKEKRETTPKKER